MFSKIQFYQVAYFVTGLIFGGLAIYRFSEGDKIQTGLDILSSVLFIGLSSFRSKTK